MKLSKIPHYVKRIRELGPSKALEIVSNRIQSSFFEQYKRHQATNKRAALNWSSIAQEQGVCDFPCFFEILKKRSLSIATLIYQQDFKDEKKLIKRADAFAHNCFDILGSRDQCLMAMPWHADFRLQNQKSQADYLFDKKKFYTDFVIEYGLTDRLAKDIKIPWELSLFQQAVVLGAAYEKTKDSLYSKAFVRQAVDWVEENPYLLGPNWVCPMDVSIRALNWVWAFHYLKNDKEIPQESWEKIITSLYNHLIYLENNWESGAHSSNHYLSDLIGYFMLTWFFNDMPSMKKKQRWCHSQLLTEFQKQIFEEGQDYEGSTAYHQLVTEIFYHFYLLSQELYLPVPREFVERLKNMFTFLDWATPDGGKLVSIGDDDSGKLVDGLTPAIIKHMQNPRQGTERHFDNFGLSIIKTKKWHLTLRHHVYHKDQPSGHFHNDMGSITVAIEGIPIIVDPGSYLYTPSVVWRNRFRSIVVHNTFFIKNTEPVSFGASLFSLEIPEKSISKPFISEHDLFGIVARRKLELDKNQTSVLLKDSWEGKKKKGTMSCWNFTLAPGIVPYQSKGEWHLFYHDKMIAKLTSDTLKFETKSGWVAPNYGTKVACKRLVAETLLTETEHLIKITAV